MGAVIVNAGAVVPFVVLLCLGAFLGRLRRAGRPDTLAEKVFAVQVGLCVTYLVAVIVFPGAPWWTKSSIIWLIPLLGVGFLAYRIYQFPDLFFPKTSTRIRAWRNR